MSEEKSDYILLFRGTRPPSDTSPEDLQAYMQRWMDWYNSLEKEGKVKGGEPLSGDGRIVSKSGESIITDGPFVESKESIAGFFHLYVNSLDEATEIAKECPGFEIGGVVEVRAVGGGCEEYIDE